MKRKLMAILFLGMAFWIGGQTAWAGTAVYSNLACPTILMVYPVLQKTTVGVIHIAEIAALL